MIRNVLSLLPGTAGLPFRQQNLQLLVAFLRRDSSDRGTEMITQVSREQCGGSAQTHMIYSRGEAVKA